MEIEINLKKDWTEIAKNELIRFGYDIEESDDEKISIYYFTLQKRLIKQKARKVLISDSFSCPNELKDNLDNLITKIELGENLNPFLSRKLKSIEEKDGLLFDWGIQHLHLGKEIEPDGFVKRTGPLLYARIDDNFAYLINVYNHGAWTMKELIRIIHKNWPDSIKQYRMIGETKLTHNYSDDEHLYLRKHQINVLMEIEPGIGYIGPGMGINTAGGSIDAVMKHIDNSKGLTKLENSIKEDYKGFLSKVFDNIDFINTTSLNFKLQKENETYILNELNNDFQIYLSTN